MHEVWSRVREGRHVVVKGTPPAPPETLEGEPRWVVVRVGCDGPWSTWGPLEDARRRIEALLGEQSPRWDEALDRMGTSTRFLGDLPEPTIEATLVGAANRFADQHSQRAALVIESLDQADDATLQALRDIVERAGWMRLPLVLGVDEEPEADGLLAKTLALVEGEAIEVETPEPSGFDWSSLDSEVLLVMRAAAVVGRSFDVELVGRLLGISANAVLVRLQKAADQGAPLADHGGGRFFVPEAAQRVLVSRVLPSLVERWHRRLGEILADPTPPTRDADVDEPRRESKPEAGAAAEVKAETDQTPEAEGAKATDPRPEAVDRDTGSYEEIFEPSGEDRLTVVPVPPDQSEPAEAQEEPEESDSSKTMVLEPEDDRLKQAAERSRDQARAAHHLSAAGLPERAVEQYLAALRKVASRGDSRRALLIAEQALGLLDRQPPSRGRDLLRARVLSVMARVQWRGAGRGPELTLQGALESLDEAEGLLTEEAPLDLRTEIAQLVAGVCYDLGDISSLQRALDALTDASRALMGAGESVRAARLLNDTAAVYLRAGDPVRANHLLQQSREIFDEMHRTRPDDPTVIVERAETEHLLARLPLHARLRPGREDDAFSMALGHARAAASGYRRLGGRVELGRVLETMGRLETARGRFDRAGDHLSRALRISQQLGDVTGLARCASALADLYIAAGRPADALGALEESVVFNVDKGSPLGLAVNRRTIERLRKAIVGDPRTSPALLKMLRSVDETLAGAEAMLGRVSVPGDED